MREGLPGPKPDLQGGQERSPPLSSASKFGAPLPLFPNCSNRRALFTGNSASALRALTEVFPAFSGGLERCNRGEMTQ